MSEEEMIHCPYNYSHVILKSRMASHLQKCREHFPMEKYTTCPFNATHDVPVPELKYHADTCPDRKTMENFLYVIDDEKKEEEPQPVEVQAVSLKENWDEEKISESYLEAKSRTLPDSKIFKVAPVGRSKSEKKAFSQQQVRKFLEDKEKVNVKKVKAETSEFSLPDEEQPVETGSRVEKLRDEEEGFVEVERKGRRKGASRGLSIRGTLMKEDYI